MSPRLLADLVVVVHLLFIVFVVAGGLLVLRYYWIAFAHLPAALWGAFIEFSGRLCPLTPLEQRLRHEAGLAGYEGGFIEHYLIPVIYPAELDRTVQIVLGLVVGGINVAIYGRLWRRHRRGAFTRR